MPTFVEPACVNCLETDCDLDEESRCCVCRLHRAVIQLAIDQGDNLGDTLLAISEIRANRQKRRAVADPSVEPTRTT